MCCIAWMGVELDGWVSSPYRSSWPAASITSLHSHPFPHYQDGLEERQGGVLDTTPAVNTKALILVAAEVGGRRSLALSPSLSLCMYVGTESRLEDT